MNSQKTAIINAIIDREGGYVNNPNDSGGATNYGITKHVARRNGFVGDMKTLPSDLAFSIYEHKYWDALNLSLIEDLAPTIAAEMADTAVNMGVFRAGEFLQRCLNVMNQRGQRFPDLNVDGAIGNLTIDALIAYLAHRGKTGESVLFKALNALQGAFYITLAERRQKDEAFVYGWIKERI